MRWEWFEKGKVSIGLFSDGLVAGSTLKNNPTLILKDKESAVEFLKLFGSSLWISGRLGGSAEII